MSKTKKIVVFLFVFVLIACTFSVSAFAQVKPTVYFIMNDNSTTGAITVGETVAISNTNNTADMYFNIYGTGDMLGYIICDVVFEVPGAWSNNFVLKTAYIVCTSDTGFDDIYYITDDVKCTYSRDFVYQSPDWYEWESKTVYKFHFEIPVNYTNKEKIQIILGENSTINYGASSLKFMSADIQNMSPGEYASIQNQNENTDKIIQNQNDLYEQEKGEIEVSSNSALEGMEGVIPDHSEGFISALTKLVNAFSSNAITCRLPFPEVKLPAIKGVMEEKVLIPAQTIQLHKWFSEIPDNLITLIRALNMCALIIFAFKELYSIISYVLTMKGGKSNE